MARSVTPEPDPNDPGSGWLLRDPEPWPGDILDDDAKYQSISEQEKSAAHGERFARVATTAIMGTLLVIMLAFVLVAGAKVVFWMGGL